MAVLKVEIALPEKLLAALDVPEAELGRQAREWVLLELFQEGRISSGKAAELLDMSKTQFLDLLSERHLPYLDSDPGDLEREIATAEAAQTLRSPSVTLVVNSGPLISLARIGRLVTERD